MVLQTGSLFIALVLGYFVSTAIYRLYIHPLADYKGPFWARLTTIPSFWHTLRQDRHVWLHRLQEEYGQYISYCSVGWLSHACLLLSSVSTRIADQNNSNKAQLSGTGLTVFSSIPLQHTGTSSVPREMSKRACITRCGPVMSTP